jgi:hypothetical protein
MLKRFLLKQAMKSQLKDISESQQDMLLDMVEQNPAFFEGLAKEMQDATAAGKDPQAVMMELMNKHKDELAKMMNK